MQALAELLPRNLYSDELPTTSANMIVRAWVEFFIERRLLAVVGFMRLAMANYKTIMRSVVCALSVFYENWRA